MGVAIRILEFLDEQPGVFVKNTGWKQGFELEVGTWTRIRTANAVAEFLTDGDEFLIRRESGPVDEFEALATAVRDFLGDEFQTNL